MIQHEEIDMSTMFGVVISKNEIASAFEKPKMTVVALPSISVSGFYVAGCAKRRSRIVFPALDDNTTQNHV